MNKQSLNKRSLQIKKLFAVFTLAMAGAAGAVETPTMGWSSWNTYHNTVRLFNDREPLPGIDKMTVMP